MYFMPDLFFHKLQNQDLRGKILQIAAISIFCYDFQLNLINDDAFVLSATADACTTVHLVCLFMKPHLLALLQDNCLDLVHCTFLRKVCGWVRNITGFCQHLLKPIKSAGIGQANTSVYL